MFEQPGLSSDHLPADEVVSIEYVPTRREDWPVFEARVDLDKGERFVRYWTTSWRNGGGRQRIFILGMENAGKHALMAIYPNYGNKLVFATTRPFEPPWQPHPFKLLPTDAILRGGPGNPAFGWIHDNFGGVVVRYPNRLVFTALYE